MIEISVVVIAVAFAILVVFLIKTLKAATKSLEKTTQTLQEVQKTIEELGYEVKQTVRQANGITVDLQTKMKQMDPVMESVHNLGEVLSEVTFAAKQLSSTVMEKMKKPKTNASSNLSNVPLSKAEQRTVQSYAALNKAKDSKDPNWVKYVDVAAGIWQKFRR
ncbi:DUF948 domain-containing protein [Paenibacillus crassostreae]|uniref:General stress protein n=1 Tax=Paenibacillus crassostreae TaxID=1763538 RepID=A0A167ETN1_9BACL|nr:DUF948 domain-containing protein [Paenibacillus crassostreae]AOZ93477.1 hypothetical protein LPB68_15530 [Paenibacillus crassostreae]OAB75868.1 hypothetical protein PNBC_07490 [Paenibacillus crassostreae]